MELIPSNTKIDFVGQTRFCSIISLVLVGLSLVGILGMGFNLGIDFRGGTQMQVIVPESAGSVDESRVRDGFAKAGFGDAEITRLGNVEQREFLVRLLTSEEETAAAPGEARAAEAPKPVPPPESAMPPEERDSSGAAVDDADGPDEEEPAGAASPATPGEGGEGGTAADAAKPAASGGTEMVEADEESGMLGAVQKALTEEFGAPVTFNSVESIGPRVGAETTLSAFMALAITSGLILVYIWMRFDLAYAPGAVAALLHDVIVTAGVFAWFQLEFDQNIIAALLVILGYSINDTVVIYDRIRENVAVRGRTLIRDVVNESLNQTLSRTILTTSFTLTVVIALLIFGGSVLRGFSLALLIGMISGVYSTVYVASAMLIWLERRRGAAAA
jgi:preprotein translocase subunit SecF